MKRISVCLIVKNEEQLLANALRSVQPIAAEIIVVDTGSSDRTIQIAERFGARVVRHEWSTYSKARNVYLREARAPWILVLDGDESIAASDLPKMERLIQRRSSIGYRLTVRNYSDEFDLMWRWSANDRSYPREEKLSRCAGWMKTQALRLFRNLPGLQYREDDQTAHPTPMEALRKHAGNIEDAEDVVVHHFQFLKGGVKFVAEKQRERLATQLAHVRRFADHPYPYLNAARTLFAEHRDAYAVKLLSRAVRLDANFHDGYQLLGMIALTNGRVASAERHLLRATEIDPRSADAFALLGMARIERGRAAAALEALQMALRLEPRHLLARNSLGVLYEDLGELKRAVREYRRALRLHPRFATARENVERAQRLLDRR